MLYEAPFVPTAAISHAQIATDDLAAMPSNFSGFQFALVAGQRYSYGPRRRAPVPVRKTAYDFDGDGKADITVYRLSNGTWYIVGSKDGFMSMQWGSGTDIPITGAARR